GFNPVRARGLAGAEPFNNQYGIMILSPTCAGGTTPTFSASSNVDLHVTGGSIWVNATCSTAVSGFTGTDFTLASPYALDIVGGSTDSFPAGVTAVTGLVSQPDPFAGFPVPDGQMLESVVNLLTDTSTITGTL